jgi:hypothetical protein
MFYRFHQSKYMSIEEEAKVVEVVLYLTESTWKKHADNYLESAVQYKAKSLFYRKLTPLKPV